MTKITPARRLHIAKRYQAGDTVQQLARRCRCSEDAILSVLHGLGVTIRKRTGRPRTFTQKRAERLIEKLGYTEAARRIGCSRQALYKRVPSKSREKL